MLKLDARSTSGPDASVDRPGGGTCGDGVIERSEQCDDGNTTNGDGCSRLCQIEANWDCPSEGKPCKYVGNCGSGVLTTNKAFAEWPTTFPNAACVVALVDRLINRADIVMIDGDSYRLREAEERQRVRATTRKKGREPTAR